MPVFALGKKYVFPSPELAEPDGLLAVGGDLAPERLLEAYRQGIFPWYQGSRILWWSPDPRFVLLPGRLKVSKSMQQLLKKEIFEFTVDKDFAGVIGSCKTVGRKDQDGTWITEEMQAAYITLHRMGYAHSAEVWQEGKLVGGLYGIRAGRLFFGESMFSKVSNASKYAFIRYVSQMRAEGLMLVDCQVYTEHLESMGAGMISRKEFLAILAREWKTP